MQTERLRVDLPHDLATLIDDLVRAGAYESESAVVEEALRLLRDKRRRAERLEEIRKELAEAAADPVVFTDDEVRRYFERRTSELLGKRRA